MRLDEPTAFEGVRPQTSIKNDAAPKSEPVRRIHPWQYVAIFLFSCAIIISRRPDAIFHAQFFGEDGAYWFGEAYNQGWWAALFIPKVGYYQTFARLGGALAQLVPFSAAPLLFSSIAVAVQAIPVNLLLSTRSAEWGSLPTRAAMAALYLALPTSREIHFGLTNSQWILALTALLLLVGFVPRTTAGRVFDVTILFLSGLTGPFCLLLFPIALYLLWRDRIPWRRVQAAILALTCMVQAWGLFVKNPSGRHLNPGVVLGATPEWFLRLLAARVYLGTLFGNNGLGSIQGRRFFIFLVCVAVTGTAIVLFCLARSPRGMKMLLVFSGALLAVSLALPYSHPASSGFTVWQWFAIQDGDRYWYFPTLAFAWSLVWLFHRPEQLLKILSAFLLFLMCIGIVRSWKQQPFDDLQFPKYARDLAAAPQGTVVTIPIYPLWQMELIKK